MHSRCWKICSAAAFVLVAQGCYEYVPVETPAAPPAGQLVELRITDPGRVGLAPRFGPGLDRLTGRMVSQRDSDVILNVLSVTNLDGQDTKWSGEEVRLDRGFIRSVSSRRLSPLRTAVMSAAAVAVLYFTAGRSLTGGGKDPRDPPDPIDPPASNRRPMGFRLRVIP